MLKDAALLSAELHHTATQSSEEHREVQKEEAMAVTAKVIKVLTTDFAEVAILDNGELSKEHYIAEFEGNKEKVRRDDYVEMVPKEGRIMNTSRWAYLLPVIGIIFAIFITVGRAWEERILTAFLLGLMTFIVAWLMNRRSRMLKRREFKVTKIVKKNPHFL